METTHQELIELLIDKEQYVVSDSRKLEDKINREPLTKEEQTVIDSIKDYVKNVNFQWNESQVEDYKFNLPETAFSEAKQLQLLNYEDAEVDYEDNENEKLSEENLKDIALKGEFSIKSKKGKVYVWKVSSWLIEGSENRWKNFLEDFSTVFEMLYYYKYRVNSKFKYANIYRVSLNFYFFVRDAFRLFYGTPFFYPSNNTFDEKIFTEYYEKVLKNVDLCTRIYYPCASRLISACYNKFQNEWNSSKYIYEDEIRKSGANEEEKKVKIIEKRLEKLIENLKKNEDINDDELITSEMRETLYMFIKAKHIVLQIENEHLNKVDLMKKQLMEGLLKEYPIMSKVRPWLNKKYFTEEKERIIELEKERNRERTEKLKDYPVALYLINSWEELESYKKHVIKELNEHAEKTPRSSWYYDFEYCVARVAFNEQNCNNVTTRSYYMKYTNQLKVSSDMYFWRIKKLAYFQLEMWWGLLIFCKKSLFNCSFGITALFCHDVEDHRIVKDSRYEDYLIIFTDNSYPKCFVKLSKWIRESRENFNKNKYTNFFGPDFGNFVNIFENYVIKAFILGTLMAIFYPVGIVLWCIFAILLTLLLLILSVVWTFLYLLFNLLIFDIDSPKHSGCPLFPVFILVIWRVVICIGFSTLAFIVLCIVQILTAILAIIYSCLHYLVRTGYDKLMYCIIGCLAKIPKTDSSVAWKIKGPGIGRTVFTSVSIDDSLVLLRSMLEKIQLGSYQTKMNELIDKPMNNVSEMNRKILSRVSCSMTVSPKVQQICSKLKNHLYNQVSKRNSIYPTECKNIRFTDKDLEVFLIASQDLIKDYVETNNMTFIWRDFKLVEGTWDLLTEKILIQCFGEGVLENVDDGAELIETKQQGREILDQIESVQRSANIGHFFQMASHKREKLARRMDFDNEFDMELSQKYLAKRKHTSGDAKFDDTHQREVNVEFITNRGPFNFIYSYLPKNRKSEELELDGDIIENNSIVKCEEMDEIDLNCDQIRTKRLFRKRDVSKYRS